MNANDPYTWARYAEEDWRLATSLLHRKQPPLRAICFHAQQSVEKYFKALLLLKKHAISQNTRLAYSQLIV